jgi:hypothetical protein
MFSNPEIKSPLHRNNDRRTVGHGVSCRDKSFIDQKH